MNTPVPETTAGTVQSIAIDYHRLMAKTMLVGGAINRGGNYFFIVADLWSLSFKFDDLLKPASALADAPNDQMGNLLHKFRELHFTIVSLVALSKTKGLVNRRLTASALRVIRTQNQELMDLIDVFEVTLLPNIKADFEKAMSEFRNGETVSRDLLRF